MLLLLLLLSIPGACHLWKRHMMNVIHVKLSEDLQVMEKEHCCDNSQVII
jgi:hypothetical protein